MNVKSAIEVLAGIVGEPEITEYLDGCSQGTLNHVERCLQRILATDAHPSAAYRSRVRAGLLDDIWDSIWEYDPHNYLKGLILDRIVFAVQRYDPDSPNLRQELWMLANLWDRSNSAEAVDEECEAVDDWDYPYLEEHYLPPDPSPEAGMNVAGRAVHYIRTGSMVGTVSAQEAIDYFGWDKP